MNIDLPLPIKWRWSTLAESCEIVLGQSPPSSTYNTEGNGLPFFQGKSEFGDIYPTPKKWCSKPQKIAKPEDILISVRAPVGPTNICVDESCIGRGLAAIRPKDNMSHLYLFYYLRLIEEEWNTKATGTTFKAISGDTLRSQVIPLPLLPEQERIVERIESLFTQLDAGIAGLKRVQAALKRYRVSVLRAACEGRLVPQDLNDEPAENLIKHNISENGEKGKKILTSIGDLSDLPVGWVWVTLSQVAVHRLGKMLDKANNKGSNRPYLRNINVRWLRFDLTDIQEMKVTDDEMNNVSIRKNDLVICEGGEPGRAAVWEHDYPFVIQKALHRVRPMAGISTKYIALRLAWDAQSGRLEKYFTGSTIKHFTGISLDTYSFPLPPANEQLRIIAEVERSLSVIQELNKAVDDNLKRAVNLRQSILKQAFEGKLF